MTGHLVSSLARRGVEVAQEHFEGKNPEEILQNIPKWGLALMGGSVLLFLFVSATLEYTIRLVIGHLAIIESPETTVEVVQYEPVTKDDEKIAQNLGEVGLLDQESLTQSVTVHTSNPLTSSIRRTKRHIVSIGGGEKAKWRGLGIFILYSVCTAWIRSGFGLVLSRIPLGFVLANMAARIFTSRLHAAWTHKVITMPSDKKLIQRMVPCAQWRELVLPTALSVGAHSVSCMAIQQMFVFSGMAAMMLEAQKLSPWIVYSIAFIPSIIGAITLALFVMMPAYVALVRKEASMLAPEEETIVPMDRTFGGRLAFVGEKLHIGDAWNSFGWEACRRLVKLNVKFAFVMAAVVVAFSHILALEFMLVAGDSAKDIVQNVALKF